MRKKLQKIGLKALDTAELAFSDVKAPARSQPLMTPFPCAYRIT